MATRDEKDKEKALDLALSQIRKQFGDGSIMRLGEEQAKVAIEAIPTGSLELDAALGIGGVPRGRVVEIFGPEASGKTTLALHILAEAQKTGGIAAFVDAEHALDASWARTIGVDLDNLLISQPDSGEEALEITDTLVRSGAIDVIAIDSVAALVPRAELEGDMGDSQVGLQARLMSQAMRKLTSSIHRSKTCVIFLNQLRMKIGVMYGSPETTTGGYALKYIRRIATLKVGQNVVGHRARVKVVKNKIAPPFREAEFDIMYDQGISKEGGLIDLGVEYGIIQKSGTWFSYGDERLGQGKENARAFLRENPELANRIESEIRDAMMLKPVGPSGGKPDTED